ncbi:MAG: glycine cleavage system aminomethyltransferase GcvT [Chitinispirillaceae bacterium]
MKKTVLHNVHQALGAKMVPFGGYEMPIQYGGIIKEHKAARSEAAIFDTCHMGEFTVEGQKAVSDLELLLSCNVGDLKIGSCRYGFLCNEEGGILDDQILYRINEQEFMMVVNAATEENDFNWIKSQLSQTTELKNISQHTAKLDIQGPGSPKIVQKILDDSICELKFYRFMHNSFNSERILISRTGYTGEIGFEIYCSNDSAAAIWNECTKLGAVPAGLGARDTLRLEMGFPLYGHELDNKRNAAESGFSRAISSKKEFIGSAYVLNQANVRQILRGIKLEGRRAARSGDTILDQNGEVTGIITSGSFSPSLGTAIAVGYLNKEKSTLGTKVNIRSGNVLLAGCISELPFYKEATARADIKKFIDNEN